MVDGRPVAVDALVERSDEVDQLEVATRPRPSADGFRALFDPAGVVVAGASSHPGKFGFVSLHNILASGYEGVVAATNRDGAEVLGISTVPSIDDLPDGSVDLVFVCTPAAANEAILRSAAAKGAKAAFVTSAGYGEAGPDGIAAQEALIALCDELDILLAGPNGQGVVSTPSSLCAQIVAPYPPAGGIGVASQSGNFVSSFLNYAVQTGVGISRAVSAGNAAAVGVADFLDHYADDPATKVGLAYVEGVPDGRRFLDRMSAVARRKPLVLVKGGATAGGQRAAASHTGSLATDDRVFDGACRQAGITRAATVEEAFEAAATFATQPLPAGPRVVVMTTAGGWGVVTADAITRSSLELAELPEDLLAAIDGKLPPRWSRNNPVDLAGVRPETPSPRSWTSSPRTPRSTRSSSSAWASRPTRLASCGPDASTPTTASSGSSPTTSARTLASPRPPPRSPIAPASRSCWRPSSPSPTRTTPLPPPFGPPVGSATRRPTEPSRRSSTPGNGPVG